MPFTTLFTALSTTLPFHFLVAFPRPSTAFPLTFHCLFSGGALRSLVGRQVVLVFSLENGATVYSFAFEEELAAQTTEQTGDAAMKSDDSDGWKLTFSEGQPKGLCKEVVPGIFERVYSGTTVRLDCNSFEATFASVPLPRIKTTDEAASPRLFR